MRVASSATRPCYVGAIRGNDYRAITAQHTLSKSKGAHNFFTLNQYSWATRSDRPDFLYHFADYLYDVGRGGLLVGFDEQVYRESDPVSDYFIDMGPVVKKKFATGAYIKLWYSIDPGHSEIKKFFVGVGYSR